MDRFLSKRHAKSGGHARDRLRRYERKSGSPLSERNDDWAQIVAPSACNARPFYSGRSTNSAVPYPPGGAGCSTDPEAWLCYLLRCLSPGGQFAALSEQTSQEFLQTPGV